MNTLIILLIMFIVVLGPSLVIAAVGHATIKALGRNPSSASKIFLGSVLLLVFAESIAIIGLMVVMQLFGSK